MQHVDKGILPAWCIVIIDDSPDDCAEIRRMLLKSSERRLTFLEAQTAATGIRAARAAVPPPTCIVLDYDLPDMAAPDVLAALAGPDGMPVCPVVVLTGGISREDGRRVLRAGAQDYMGKDWSRPQSLIRAIEKACETWAMARELRQQAEALQAVMNRDNFRSLFADAIRDLRDDHTLKQVASHLLEIGRAHV